jgi:hypothetical protein
LSRMMGNYQVRFLGDEGGVIRLSYLTKTLASSITQRYKSIFLDLQYGLEKVYQIKPF